MLMGRFEMSTGIKPSKEKARTFVVQSAPQCAEILQFYQSRGGWISLPERLVRAQKDLRIEDYSTLYEDERRLGVALMLSAMSETEFKELNAEWERLATVGDMVFVDELLDGVSMPDELPDFPATPEEEERLRQMFEQLPADEQAEVTRRGRFFWAFVCASFHQYIAVMVHGEKLTSLVPRAIAGDEDAFCKAVQIDRSLLSHHPKFSEIFRLAHERGHKSFLQKVAYRLANPGARGKIRYPGLWMVFAMLDTLGWLDSLQHDELLDICDEAGLHRFQNRIEDVGYLRKRLYHYRRTQKLGFVSMQ